jgi:hypothetical protein
MNASPSVCSRPGKRSLSQASRTRSRAYFGVSMRWDDMNRSSVSGPPWRGGGSPRSAAGTESIWGGAVASIGPGS